MTGGDGSRTTRCEAAAGFTLIELLVVVSVLAILISILLPSLGGARRAAQQSACGSNLRQFGAAALTRANDAKGELCSGPFDNRRTKNWGSILKKGWVADFVTGEYAVPGRMLCPSNIAASCQNLAMNRINSSAYPDPLTGGAFTRERVDAIIKEGFNTNYTQSWYMAYTGLLNHMDDSGDPGRRTSVHGPLTLARMAKGGAARVPLFADARTDASDVYQIGTRQMRGVKALTDGPLLPSNGFMWGRQSYRDFGPAHGKGTFIGAGPTEGDKGHDALFANFVFGDGHVAAIADRSRDGVFGSHEQGGRPVYDEIEGTVFGGWLLQTGVDE